jgi:FAD/FMN-containing dehydrogenase
MMTLPGALLRSLAGTVGEPHVLTGDATAGFAVDGRHENAVFTFVASLGGSISAEHGIGGAEGTMASAGAH